MTEEELNRGEKKTALAKGGGPTTTKVVKTNLRMLLRLDINRLFATMGISKLKKLVAATVVTKEDASKSTVSYSTIQKWRHT